MPIRADLHECGHNGDATTRGQLPVSMCLQWHISHYAYLLNKLKSSPEGAGTVLDNSAIIFMPEAGHGTQLNDSTSVDQTHSVEKMVLLVGGRAGGLKPGRHISDRGPPPRAGAGERDASRGLPRRHLGRSEGQLTRAVLSRSAPDFPSPSFVAVTRVARLGQGHTC